jgi:hypothetical protein
MKKSIAEQKASPPEEPRPPAERGRGRSAVVNELVNPMQRFLGYKIRRVEHVVITELNDILGALDLLIMDFAILSIVDRDRSYRKTRLRSEGILDHRASELPQGLGGPSPRPETWGFENRLLCS